MTVEPFDLSHNWKLRAVAYAHGTQTPLGMILCAALGQMPKHPPAMALSARIDIRGQVVAGYVDPTGHGSIVSLGNIALFRGTFNSLADKLKFSDQERTELFDALRQWIAVDERARGMSHEQV